jgi:SPFH domain/Band 7 family protein
MNATDTLYAPYEPGYSNNQTVQLTQQRQNQQILDPSKPLSGITKLFFSVIKPLTCCFVDCVQVQLSQDVIVSRWGIVEQILREPGIYSLGCAGLDTEEVYVGGWQGTIDDLPVNDRNSFPCYLSATYNYQVVDALAATYKVSDYKNFVYEQAKVCLKTIFSHASYKRYNQNTLESWIINIFQSYVSFMGIQINSFKVTSLQIDRRLQKDLLAKQEAQAYINGKEAIAQGAASILKETLDKLHKDNIQLSSAEKNALVVDLIYMIIQNDDVKVRFIEGSPTETEAIVAITTESKDKHNNS